MIENKLEKFIKRIENVSLIGEKAHKEMSPTNRNMSVRSVIKKTVRKAAVLVVLYQEDDTVFFPLIERHVYDGNHSGEIGLPGGKIEDFDENVVKAALRETEEELGIAQNNVEIIKQLTPIYIPPSNFLVTPYVGVLFEKPIYKPDSFEVKTVIDLSVKELLNEENLGKTAVNKKHLQAEVPAFIFKDTIVWGATACILNEFKYLLKK